jgi:sugar phosphate isomerase/epimerase
MKLTRRNTIKNLLALPLAASGLRMQASPAAEFKFPANKQRLKTSLNAFSFNAPLTAGTMDIQDMMSFCADLGFDGIDITGYYFKGYPNVPEDEYLYGIKRRAHALNMEITGTGVRNDFTIPDKNKREAEVQRVLAWIEVAAKLGAPVLRIFGGQEKQAGYTRVQVLEWMLPEINRCVEHGKKHGVIIGLQNLIMSLK